MQPKHAHFLVKWSKVGERRKEKAGTETRALSIARPMLILLSFSGKNLRFESSRSTE